MRVTEIGTGQEIKTCCAAFYGTDWARLLIGDSMHPGGWELTMRLGHLLELSPGSRVLDVACGRGSSALRLAGKFGCEVVGVDLSAACVDAARREAIRSDQDGRVSFEVGDAETLAFGDGEFDAVVCECAFCTFPDKVGAASEMARVLKLGGRLGLSDLVARGELAPELRTLTGWVACIADAGTESEYLGVLEDAGFVATCVETHDDALAKLVKEVRARLIGATVLTGLRKLDLAGVDLDQAGIIGRAAELAVRNGVLGYILLTAVKA